jgi:hypothetical protein
MKFLQFKKPIVIALIQLLLINNITTITHIELKKSSAKYHHEYLQSLKFMQLNSNKSAYTSFLEEKDINLHQQVLAQKRLATYYGELEVGMGCNGDTTSKQSFKMLFDTGSCEFWIPSAQCNTNRCKTHNRYARSNTYESYQGSKMAIQYLSGKVEGDMAWEDIFLGDLRVPKQVIGIADNVEIPLLDEVIWDGILGLAYANKNLRNKHINTLFDNIINQGLLHSRGEKNQFAYYLGWDKGAITFGGADMRFKKNMDEEFKWAPISERNYWTITLLDIKKYKTTQVRGYFNLDNSWDE